MGTYQQGTPIEIFDTFTVAGVATDPTQIVYNILGPDGTLTVYTWPGSIEITHISQGEFLLNLDPPADPGDYQYDVNATGTVVASRAGTFTVIADAADPTDISWAVPGPCTPWATAQNVWECCGRPMTTIGEGTDAVECPVDMTQYAAEASYALWELSGRIFGGACEKTVRPCSERWCGFQVLSRGHIVWDWASWVGWGGSGWSWYGHNGCGCTPLDRILLSGYPVREVTEVKIDGVVLDPAEYRLDERRYLVRMADADGTTQFWPSCQRLDLDDDEAGTFSVTYRYGADPPVLGIAAAGQLGCELYKACTGGDCALPSGVTRIQRTGVTIDKSAFLTWAYVAKASRAVAPGWKTGLGLVDAFLSSANSAGIKRRPSVWSPDGLQYARSVGQ